MRNTDLGMRHLKGVDFFMTARMKRSAIRGDGAINFPHSASPFDFAQDRLHAGYIDATLFIQPTLK